MALSTSATDTRVFLYEVSGLRQNDVTDKNTYPIRNSSNFFVRVPFSRLNEQTRKITRLGGTIVSIRPLTESAS